MVIISGETFDVSKIIDEYPPGSVERQLLETMSKSAAKYRFDSAGELRFELKFRKAVVDSAGGLSRSGLKFAVFNKSKRNEEYWDRTDNGGFRLKDGASPAEAINDIFANGRKYATECATAMVIVFYKAALDVFGAAVFNRLFPQIYLMNWHGIDPLLQGIGEPRDLGDMLYGDRAYFANPDVDPKTPEWRGENVIVLPGGLYYGHGIGIAPAGRIIEALNRNRKQDATRSAYLLNDVARPDYRRLYRAYEQFAERPTPTRASAPAAQPAPEHMPAPASASAPSHIVWGPFPDPVSSARAGRTVE